MSQHIIERLANCADRFEARYGVKPVRILISPKSLSELQKAASFISGTEEAFPDEFRGISLEQSIFVNDVFPVHHTWVKEPLFLLKLKLPE